jgi:hypothetical protein
MAKPVEHLLSPRVLTLTAMILLVALARLLPHPPNFAPVESMALFAGALFVDRRLAILVPLAAMAISDVGLELLMGSGYGFHRLLPLVYVCIAATVLLGFLLRGRIGVAAVAGASVVSALGFFLVTNFAVWWQSSMYPQTWQGLVACYVAALPFLNNAIAGALVYSAVLFGGYALLRRRYPALAAQTAQAVR